MDSLKKAFSSSTEQQDDTTSFLSTLDVSKLGWKNRLIGFGVCLSLAGVFAVLGCALAYVSTPIFAVFFTIGTICGICSTFFIVGPIAQVKKLFNKDKLVTSIIRLVAIGILVFAVVFAFLCVFLWDLPGIAILLCILQFLALAAYGITYAPFAETVISRGGRSAWSTLSSGDL